MTNETILNSEQIAEKTDSKKTDWWYLLAVVLMLGGVSAIVVGQGLTFLIWLLHLEIVQISLQTFTNFLFYSSLPMLFLGACCLDKVEEKKKQRLQNKEQN